MTAVLLPFPERRPERSCWDCVHHVSSAEASFCMQYQEEIISERVAALNCPTYTAVDL